jgi:eukaryotic-like serine/threonine-protein kinase
MCEGHETSNPWSSDRDRFLAIVLASQLLDQREIVAAVDGLSNASDVAQLAEHLVAQGALTKWQCNKLRNGQYKGFFLGKFKLFDCVSASYYLAEECQTKRKVRLLLMPNPKWPGGIEYRIVE